MGKASYGKKKKEGRSGVESLFSQNYVIWKNKRLFRMVESVNPRSFELKVGPLQTTKKEPKRKRIDNKELRKQ